MRSTMAVGIVAALAVAWFVAALVAVIAGLDRAAAATALLGLISLSLAVLVHVTDAGAR